MAKRKRNRNGKYRSQFEKRVAQQLTEQKVDFKYETVVVPFIQPEKKRTYTPDFILPNGIIVETKGRFVSADRIKHLLIKTQRPELDIRFVFQNPNGKISKKSRTTYAMWCDKHGFKWAGKEIPEEWISEVDVRKSL